ncbi:MAG: hypothetical protein JNK82_01190 [Myxococcaceae bacterium]|nr:hypothetical protein [Myxococcaceae bacterium]
MSRTLFAVIFVACTGEVSAPAVSVPEQRSTPSNPSTPVTPVEPEVVIVDRPKVTLPPAPLKLLPFETRLARTAAAVGVPVTDALFDAARAKRLDLGAHDFANGTAPDLQWNAQRMSLWVEVMLPVCRDARVRSHLGSLDRAGVQKFAAAGWGRDVADEDLADLATTLAIPGNDGWVASCLVLVSSAELLVQ